MKLSKKLILQIFIIYKSKLGLAKERQKDEESFICPYSGAKISQTNCEYDHILPRSKGLYNSLANLIPTSSTSNQIKSNTKYLLSNLDENYLKYIFAKKQTTDLNSFKAFIDENISKIDENDFTNFKNLSFFEQIAFRHALFLDTDDNSFKKALRLLKLDTIKTHSNGTQKRFINIFIEKISKLTQSGIDLNFIDSKLVSSTRKDLAQNDTSIAKQEIQDSHSHCVDASIVFYLANSKIIKGQIEPDYDYFKDIYPKDSDIILPQSKQYLELNQKSQKSKKLFDDSVYSLVYEGKFDEKQKKILTQYELLKENGFVDTHKVFELIFKSFKDKDTIVLKDLKFLDNHLKSYIRKDIFSIFFNEKGELKEAKELKSATKNIDKFYTILSQNQDKIYTIKLDEKAKEKKTLQRNKVIELYKEIFYTKNAKPRARGKNRVTFSLPVYAKDAKYAIKRNSGFAGLKNKDIATKTYIDIDSREILKIPYYSTNVLPIRISDILVILSLQSKNAKQIYKIKIQDNLPKQIVSLDFILSQANRHEVLVSFDKSKLEIQNINDDNDENAFIQKYLCDDFKEFLGKPRDNKIEIIKNNDDILAIKYCVENTSKANKEIIVKALSDETPSA
ncbi:HNH endonuclease domain-containing protein [Campylobacter lanienae]|uniref:HNH endonuclease domain-containing protein n=1 Tax=Campylobacter lanienae TaxID=75658 RepID=UPI00242AAEE1|nr:HNH endonuclease domain-containing protein [Campylobacter lanienae]MDD5786614.1 HNH endonuclease domain-containing protein [Campylobacter lanienae]